MKLKKKVKIRKGSLKGLKGYILHGANDTKLVEVLLDSGSTLTLPRSHIRFM